MNTTFMIFLGVDASVDAIAGSFLRRVKASKFTSGVVTDVFYVVEAKRGNLLSLR